MKKTSVSKKKPIKNEIINFRVEKRLKEALTKYGVDIAETCRRALEASIWELRRDEVMGNSMKDRAL